MSPSSGYSLQLRRSTIFACGGMQLSTFTSTVLEYSFASFFLLKYFHCMLLYTYTPIHLRGKYRSLIFATHLYDLLCDIF